MVRPASGGAMYCVKLSTLFPVVHERSTGSDGALNLTTPGVVLFDPSSFNPPLDPDGGQYFPFHHCQYRIRCHSKLSGRKN